MYWMKTMRVLSLLITQIEDSGLRDVIKVHECFGLASCGLCEFFYFQSITNKRVFGKSSGVKRESTEEKKTKKTMTCSVSELHLLLGQ